MAPFAPGSSGWLLAFGTFVGVVAAAIVLQVIAGLVLSRVSAHWSPLAKSLFARTKGLAHFAFLVLAAAVALPLAPLTPAATEVAQRVLTAGFIALLGWVAIVATQIAADRYVARFTATSADNLLARKAITQVRILSRAAIAVIVVVTIGLALMTFDAVRQYGVSLFASAGVFGIVVGLAAQPTLGNLLAGIQLALTQPIRLGDAVVVEGEFGRIEEINSTYVVVKLWDWRRLIVPLTYFLQNPFQNWTRSSASIIGAVLFYFDYAVPVEALRAHLKDIVRSSPLWDGDVVAVQVTDIRESTIQLRVLVSARDSATAFDLRCEVREKLLAFVRDNYPAALPRRRSELIAHGEDGQEQQGGQEQQAGQDMAPKPAKPE